MANCNSMFWSVALGGRKMTEKQVDLLNPRDNPIGDFFFCLLGWKFQINRKVSAVHIVAQLVIVWQNWWPNLNRQWSWKMWDPMNFTFIYSFSIVFPQEGEPIKFSRQDHLSKCFDHRKTQNLGSNIYCPYLDHNHHPMWPSQRFLGHNILTINNYNLPKSHLPTCDKSIHQIMALPIMTSWN